VVLDARNEPQPDITVVRRPWHGYPDAHPGPEDICLLIEVADTSIATDRGAKRELYARAGIPEYWLIDLTTDRVHVHRKPKNGVYATMRTVGPDALLEIEALPGVTLKSAALFG
ncbi:MAG TPA: Uma2 family endonuclease, partial [Acetobacteraceae bacterium]|nr:Uma2 family endonuclease [Acetobacteraceae bacterium]